VVLHSGNKPIKVLAAYALVMYGIGTEILFHTLHMITI
jgi:hypothetical protein